MTVIYSLHIPIYIVVKTSYKSNGLNEIPEYIKVSSNCSSSCSTLFCFYIMFWPVRS